jgi:hypothetical protein
MVQASNHLDLLMVILIHLGHLMELELEVAIHLTTPILPSQDGTFQIIVHQILVMDITPALILPNTLAMDIPLKTLSSNKEVLTEDLMVAMILCLEEWEVEFHLRWQWVIQIFLSSRILTRTMSCVEEVERRTLILEIVLIVNWSRNSRIST